ncbi:hypothetical protein ACIBG8_08790 [Nonomuraea sp. NPDC050556]|uniref:hypothetical protein n=1 Tax=Nonomuraea sp. NPDC050556 TaxID=3364369 RepID=UPI00379A77AF
MAVRSGSRRVRGAALFNLIPDRRTSREPYTGRRVEAGVWAELRTAASREGATLVTLDDRHTADLLDYAAIAEEELAHDGDYLAELAAWTTSDGVPAHVQGPRSKGDRDQAPPVGLLPQPAARPARHAPPHHRRGHPQMISRFGYGPYVPRAPRRPVTELELTHA